MEGEPLAGRHMIVVGGSAGIGQGIAVAWADAGADVIVCSRTEPDGLRDKGIRWTHLDLAETKAARDTLAAVAAGPLDAVCFSAVYYGAKRSNFREVAEQEWRRQLEVNTTGLWLTLSATLPALGAGTPGLFVGVSSEVAFNAGPGRSGYAASKAAARALLDSVAQEEDGDQVCVVQVLPAGMVDSPGIRRRRPAGFDYSSYMRPDAFARLAVELAVTRGRDHHGDSLVVDGDGEWWSVDDRLPASQNRPVAS
ncbi:SDR family oxidoreductase [Frankia sp. CiP3]|uniref:SDR family NAD(P)-dependent oxidoreductase n=1 Tax=Frankia sp. CiP3 TaxID=2880971 RepID=UPI001EF597DF|nr:SDR family NAD(P)-dependent oxidoreductase [Frankia sp. CiP3]